MNSSNGSKKSKQIALGGVFSSVSLIIMFFSSIIPFATFSAPIVAGAVLYLVKKVQGVRIAVMVYISVSLLSIIIVPDKEAALLFVAFFGYYPVAKEFIEKCGFGVIKLVLKLLIFNATVTIAYLILMKLMGMAYLYEEFGQLGRYGALIMLIMGNFLFVIYDKALSRLSIFYEFKLKKIFGLTN